MVERIRIRRGQRLEIKLDKNAMLRGLEDIAEEARQEAIVDVKRGGRSGRYRSDGQRASVVGEAPYHETGELAASIRVVRKSGSVGLGSTAEHGAYHETHGRPFLLPAIQEATRRAKKEFLNPVKARAR